MATETAKNPAPAVKKSSGSANKILITLVIVLAGATAYLYTSYAGLKENPAREAQAEVDKLVSQIGKLMVLPEGEQPTVATVTDVEKLKDQPFFAKAENGNKVLIYTGAKKAILFDQAANKIIEVAPINIGDSTKSQQSRPAPAPVQTTPTEAAEDDN